MKNFGLTYRVVAEINNAVGFEIAIRELMENIKKDGGSTEDYFIMSDFDENINKATITAKLRILREKEDEKYTLFQN